MKSQKFPRFAGLVMMLVLLTSCVRTPPFGTPVPPPPTSTTQPTLTPLPTAVLPLETAPTEIALALASTLSRLRIWLPPQFEISSDNPAAALLAARLSEFSARRDGVQIEVRTKDLTGAGGMLDALAAANAAAPLALPDLLLLPRATLETAALKGLLYSFDGQSDAVSAEDWYDYAQNLGRLQDSNFGIPFAGDALLLLYRPAAISDAPYDWVSALSLTTPLLFPAADEQALFTLTQYLAAGGEIQDGEGRPTLDVNTLTQVLTFYQNAEKSGLMPFWLTQYTSDEQIWQLYNEGRAQMLITRASRYLSVLPADTSAVPLFTPQGSQFTLADGWIWAFANPQIERRLKAIELAEFLTEGDFLARWVSLAGFLPPRSSALQGWSDPTLQRLIDQISRSAQVIPASDVLIALSPALRHATLRVLKEQADPLTASQEAFTRLSGR